MYNYSTIISSDNKSYIGDAKYNGNIINKRNLLADAAEKRGNSWRQNNNPVSDKDRLIFKIKEIYRNTDKSPPIGLALSNSQTLQSHYNFVKKNQK